MSRRFGHIRSFPQRVACAADSNKALLKLYSQLSAA
jgi:hypothetical protein